MIDITYPKGPWHKGAVVEIDGRSFICIDAPGFGAVALVNLADDICSDTYQEDIAESHAIATLLSCAPDLLDALTTLLAFYISDYSGKNPVVLNAQNVVRAALGQGGSDFMQCHSPD